MVSLLDPANMRAPKLFEKERPALFQPHFKSRVRLRPVLALSGAQQASTVTPYCPTIFHMPPPSKRFRSRNPNADKGLPPPLDDWPVFKTRCCDLDLK